MIIFQILIEWGPYLLGGAAITLGLVASALAIGFIFGLPLALGQVYGSAPIRAIIAAYVWFFRGAIQSIPQGQMTAALSLGMTPWMAIKSIILPQSLRLSLPGWSNEYPEILTDSAVCYAIGVVELLTRTSQVVSQTYMTMPVYMAAAVMFILLNYAGMWLIQRVEQKIAIPGFGIKAV